MPRTSLSVLLVEDDETTIEVTCVQLRRLGSGIQVARSLLQANSLLDSMDFQLVILDQNLQGRDSAVVLEHPRLRKAMQQGTCRVLATSAEFRDEQRQVLRSAGVENLLQKPVAADIWKQLLGDPSTGSDSVVEKIASAGNKTSAGAKDSSRLPILDDEAARIACGQMGTVQALRGLLQAELMSHHELYVGYFARGDFAAYQDKAHQLKSALALCGAPALRAELDAAGAAPEDAAQARILQAMSNLSVALGGEHLVQ
jgi:CheY-like chemotaxis protein